MQSRNSKIKRNLVSSLIYQLVLISMSFLLPRLYLENFGSEINGVLSTVKQIFTYMCLLEAGIGLASTQALYKRIGGEDKQGASAVVAATGIHYRKTGAVYLVLVLVIASVYAFLVPTPIESHILFLIVLLNAVPSLFGYFVQAKYRVLMEADGRRYVLNHAETALQLLSNAGKLLVLLLTDSLILIQLVYCVLALLQLLFLYIYAKREYTWLDLKAKPDHEAVSQKNSVLIHQISGMVFNNTDIILISVLCDFKAVSIYTIYNIFFSQVQNFITSITSSFTHALGQLFHKDNAKFQQLFNVYETFYVMVTYFIYTLMAVFLLPLVQLYTKGINDAEYTNTWLVFLFALMNLAANGKLPMNGVIEYAGQFQKTRAYAIWEMVINITVSVAAVLYFGICGALFGTLAALIYRGVVTLYYGNRKILMRKQRHSYKILLSNAAVFAAVMAVLFVDTFSGLSFWPLVLQGLIHSVWIAALYLAVNFIVNRAAFKTAFALYRGKKNS